MASQALTILETQLHPLAPRLAQALAGQMPVERLIRTILISVERLPTLLECDRQSLFMSAMSAACLGLEVDGVTGQAFLIPFKNRAQLVIGYKGFNTLAARADLTITGSVVREGDAFDYEKGSSGFVRHKPRLDGNGRIVGAWACATHLRRPPIVEVLGFDALMATKNKSPGARRSDSPWNDPAIGFPAMCEKTAKRRLARSMPLSVIQVAARLDEAVEEDGRAAWITPEDGLAIKGTAEKIGVYESSDTPTAEALTGPDILSQARDKVREGKEAFDEWYADLTDAERKIVDTKRKTPAKAKTEDVI